jgi:hypothetical protein
MVKVKQSIYIYIYIERERERGLVLSHPLIVNMTQSVKITFLITKVFTK